jgi:hypothetical protein
MSSMAGIVKQITAWSLSRLQTYEQCPAKAKFSYIDKIPYVRGPAQLRGEEIHKEAQAFLEGKLRKLPPSLRNYEEDFVRCRAAGKDPEAQLFVEQQWGFDARWQPTGWFGKDTWGRMIADMVIVHGGHVKVEDHKTGKHYDNHVEQLEINAVVGLHRFPEAQTASGHIWYLDHPKTVVPELTLEFSRADLPRLEKKYERRVKPMLADKRFAPRPGPQCRWCDYQKAKGGPCRF